MVDEALHELFLCISFLLVYHGLSIAWDCQNLCTSCFLSSSFSSSLYISGSFLYFSILLNYHLQVAFFVILSRKSLTPLQLPFINIPSQFTCFFQPLICSIFIWFIYTLESLPSKSKLHENSVPLHIISLFNLSTYLQCYSVLRI